MKVLLIGGSKSGKTMMAQNLCKVLSDGGPMTYWATMEPTDEEDLHHIALHRQERSGWGFATVECGSNLDAQEIGEDQTVLLDSATAILSNEMFGKGMDADAAEPTAEELIKLGNRVANMVYVIDNIWQDGECYDHWTECFRRGLALIGCRLAEEADVVIEVVAGIPHYLKGEALQ